MKRLQIDDGRNTFIIEMKNMDLPILENNKYNSNNSGFFVDMITQDFINADGSEFIYWDLGLCDSAAGKSAMFIDTYNSSYDGLTAVSEDPIYLSLQEIGTAVRSAQYDGGNSFNPGDEDFYCNYLHSTIRDKAHLFIASGSGEYDSSIYHGDIT